ncbi:MAG: BON domain-containing protein [Xanthomonadales bacterium]|nr:BON domain-containing protein [Xanthomonadales bacterium]
MKLKRNNLYRTITAAIATTALTAGLATAAVAGEGAHQSNGWQGELRDAWIDGKIEASFSLSQYLNPFDIDTRVDKGTVRLTGVVDSQIDKDLAEEIALGIDGVTEVHNELTVVEPEQTENAMAETADKFSGKFNDATTTARVKFALLANDSTEGLRVNVDTENGTVILKGSVESEQERELAERIAMNAEGVVSVENRLTVEKQS